MNIHSTKQSTVRTGASSITQSFPAKQLQKLASEEVPNIPQPFIVEKHQELPEGKSALLMNEASLMTPPLSAYASDIAIQQRHTRGLYSHTKTQVFSANRPIPPINKSLLDRNIFQKPQKSNTGRRKTSGFLLLVLLSILGVVQSQTDCQIMIDWLPSLFSGTGTACCTQTGITCYWGRIEQM
jgi:hypothetical protein